MARRVNDFQTIRSEGGLLPHDLLRCVIDPKERLDGIRPEDYGLLKGERINEVITQSWTRLRKYWAEFRDAAARLPEGEPGTGLTNDKWSLPLLRELGFGLLPTTAGPEVDGRAYAVNRFFGPVPIHLIGCGLSLDRRAAGVRGAASINPHGLVQELLNRSSAYLWAIVSNGRHLRLLRANQALSRQSFLEFDIEAMFEGEVYPDFVLLWLMTHATRFAPREDGRPETCWLEQWTKLADEQGTRALGELRQGVEQALQVLGEGFTGHPQNTALRDRLRSGETTLTDFHGQLLRIVYRLILLFVAEDRTIEGLSLLHPRNDIESARLARERYAEHYSTARLREMAGKIKGSRHSDLWRQFQLLVGALSGDSAFAIAREQLALPALGSFLWDPEYTSALKDAELTNHDFLEALRNLAFTRQGKVLRPVNYKNLGAEELGGVYESLLALTPQISADGARFTFAEFSGSERKTSGSYYTPDLLVQCLLDSALDPVVENAIRGRNGAAAEEAILDLKVCDPAVGSGHFLVGAAHRLAHHLARVRAVAHGDSEPTPLLYQQALRDVIGRCLYGVDINPMAAELCRVGLWLEALEPGKPLSFLDHHIRVGNSLLGTTPEHIAEGLPDAAFNPIEGDDKNTCSSLKKRNKKERQYIHQQTQLHLMVAEPQDEYNRIGAHSRNIEKAPDDTLDEIKNKANQFQRLVVSPEYQHAQLVADAWCATFVCVKRADALYEPITTDTIRRLLMEPEALTTAQKHAIEILSQKYQFFQWHLAFPEVFERGGFDCVLGNPPWERLKLQEKEFFAARNPEIANAPNAAARHLMIAKLPETDPTLYQAFQNALRQADGESRLVRDTGRYPLCGRGDVNTYAIFAELKRCLLNPNGRVGCIVPSGIATDDTTKFFFQSLMDGKLLHSLFMFENEGRLFPGIDHRNKFALLTISGGNGEAREVDIVFGVNAVEELSERERHYTLTANDIVLLNPNTRTCPIFRYKKDAELTKYVYQRVPVLVREPQNDQPEENPWGIKFATMFHMANDSGLFRTKEQMEAEGFVLSGNVFILGEDVYLPLYEGKMLWHFDHRFGTYQGQTEAQANQGKLPELTPEQHADPDFPSLPRYWVSEENVKARVPRRPELLASAMELPERWRSEAVIKTFCYWSAGYWRKAGDEEQAKRLLAVALDPSLADSEIDVLNQWLLDEQCEKMQEKYPLTEADVGRMTGTPEYPIPLAEELLERFSPHWFVAFRDITTAVVLRTAVFSILPKIAVGHKAPLTFTDQGPMETCCFMALMNSFALDYVARQSIGGSSMSYFILKQLPVTPPDDIQALCPWNQQLSLMRWVGLRVLELTETAWNIKTVGDDCGYDGPPFRWSEERRHMIRCELDAAFFHLYLGGENDWNGKGTMELLAYFPTPRHATEYILDTFRILRERDEAACGTYRTKDTILEIYDQMARVMAENAMAVTTGVQPTAYYQTRLNPPPGPPMDAAGNFLSMADWDRANWPSHIHLPNAEAIGRPEEVPLEEFAAMVYPATESDRAICAAALAIIEQSRNISSADHLDTLLMTAHPDWCKMFLNQSVHHAFETIRSAAPGSLFVATDQSIKWKDSRDYLEQQQAISVDHGNRGQAMNAGVNMNLVKNGLPENVNEIVKYALLAMKRVNQLRKDLSAIPQDQRRVIQAMDQQRGLNQLAA